MFEEQFVINEEIGRGGMGRVYGGVHIKTQTPVVLKTTIDATAQWSGFEQEARAAARLHHPNIVETYDYGILKQAYTHSRVHLDAGAPYLIMARLPLQPLSTHLPKLSVDAIKRIIDAIFDALAHAHARGVIHRDLKPGNVLADPSGEHVVLIDFGLSNLRHDQARASGGTPQYMAPEQFTDALHDGEGPWTDLYALGCMIFEMASGYPPFLATSREQLFEQKWASRHQPWPPRIPASLQQWVARLMAREPAERFSHVAHARAAYEQVQWAASDAPAPMISTSAFASTAWSIAQHHTAAHFTSSATPTVEHVTIVVPPDYPELSSPPEALMDLGVSLFQHREVPLIGRRDAQEALWRQLKQTIDTGQAHAVMVEGFAGLGKTAMLRQLKHHAHSACGLDTITLTHQGDLQQTLAEALDHHFDTHRLPDRSSVLAKLQRRLSDRADGARQARALLDLMRPGQQQLEDAQLWDRLIDWLHGSETPVLVMMDNVQRWSHGPDQWHTIFNRLAHEPVFFVLARRNEQDTRAFEHLTTIELDPLSDDEQAEFIRQWLCFEPEIIRAICQRTGGNPFFAHQVIQDWILRGVLVPSRHGFVLDEQAQTIIPESIQGVLGQRLEHLDDASRALLLRCALLGHNINAVQWGALTESVEQETIEILQGQGLIEQTPSGVRFVHNIVQEYVATTAPSGPALRQAHADCARTFDALPFRTAAQELQHHQHLLYGHQFERMFAVLSAVVGSTTYEQSLAACALTETYLESQHINQPQYHIELQCRHIAIYANNLRADEALELDARVREMLERIDDQAFSQSILRRLALIKSSSLAQQGQYEEAKKAAQFLLNQLEHLSEKMERTLYMNLSDLYIFQSDGQQALHYLKLAQPLSRDIWDDAWIFYGQAMAHDELKQVQQGLIACDEAQRRFEQLEDTIGIASCELVRGYLHINRADTTTAIQAFERAQEMYISVGDGAQWYAVEGILTCLILQDRFEEASTILQDIQHRLDAGEVLDVQVTLIELACHIYHQNWQYLLKLIDQLQSHYEPNQEIIAILTHMQHHLEHCDDQNARAAFERCLQWSMSTDEEEEVL